MCYCILPTNKGSHHRSAHDTNSWTVRTVGACCRKTRASPCSTYNAGKAASTDRHAPQCDNRDDMDDTSYHKTSCSLCRTTWRTRHITGRPPHPVCVNAPSRCRLKLTATKNVHLVFWLYFWETTYKADRPSSSSLWTKRSTTSQDKTQQILNNTDSLQERTLFFNIWSESGMNHYKSTASTNHAPYESFMNNTKYDQHCAQFAIISGFIKAFSRFPQFNDFRDRIIFIICRHLSHDVIKMTVTLYIINCIHVITNKLTPASILAP